MIKCLFGKCTWSASDAEPLIWLTVGALLNSLLPPILASCSKGWVSWSCFPRFWKPVSLGATGAGLFGCFEIAAWFKLLGFSFLGFVFWLWLMICCGRSCCWCWGWFCCCSWKTCCWWSWFNFWLSSALYCCCCWNASSKKFYYLYCYFYIMLIVISSLYQDVLGSMQLINLWNSLY